MRKTLEVIALAVLVGIWVMLACVLLESHPLFARILAHFDLWGRPGKSGTPALLWVLPIGSTIAYIGMTVGVRFPSAFNYPVQVTPANRARLEALTFAMVAWLKAEIVCLFAGGEYLAIHAERGAHNPVPDMFVPLGIVTLFATIGWHIAAMRRLP